MNRITFLALLVVVSINCMENQSSKKMIPLQLCDCDEVYDLEKWKVKESNTLYKGYLKWKNSGKECEALPVSDGIILNDVILFSGALDCNPCITEGQDSLHEYYKKLSADDQRALIAAAGKHGVDGKSKKLNAKRLTVQLLEHCFEKEFIAANILKNFGAEKKCLRNFFVTHLLSDAVANNVVVTTSSEAYKGNVDCRPDGLHYLPIISDIIFDGIPSRCFNTYQGQQLMTQYVVENNMHQYYITMGKADGTNQETTRTIWMNDVNDEKIMIKELVHSRPITSMACSSDGRYVASCSHQGQLKITDLGLVSENIPFSDTVLIPHNSSYKQICFNNAGTILLSACLNITTRGILGKMVLWDVETKEEIQPSLEIPSVNPMQFFFSPEDSRLVTISLGLPVRGQGQDKHNLISIWDMNEKKLLSSIDVEPDICFQKIAFAGNVIVIPTQTKIFIVDHDSGDIMKTIVHAEYSENPYIVIIPQIIPLDKTFIALGMRKKDKQSCVKIIDCDTQQCITMNHSEGDLNHIGTSSGSRRIISTFENHTLATSYLYTDDDVSAMQFVSSHDILYQYLLWRLVAAKKNGVSPLIHASLYNYLENNITNARAKAMVKKYLLNL